MPGEEETKAGWVSVRKLTVLIILTLVLVVSGTTIDENPGDAITDDMLPGAVLAPVRGQSTRASVFTVESPGGETSMSLHYGGSILTYDLYIKGEPVMEGSFLGLVLEGNDPFPSGNVQPISSRMNTVDGRFTVEFSEGHEFREHYRNGEITFKESEISGRTISILIRAYDECIAFRYSVPEQEGMGKTTIVGESTTFAFTSDHLCFAEYGTEEEYLKVPISKVRSECEVPLTVEAGDGRYLSIGEASLMDHSRMLLRNAGNRTTTLGIQYCARVKKTPYFETPWRVITVGEHPGDLVERSHVLYSLCPENRIGNTSWIRPGKAFRDCSLTTNGSKATIDFCQENGLQYVHLDAGWYGKEHTPSSDATSVSARDLDLHEVIEYGKERDVGVILYVNNRSLRKQLDKILPLYQEWGIKGIKFGFIDGRSQDGINFIHSAVEKAARHNLIVVIHDNYRPTGLTRTYPNIMTVEGVRGNEHFPSSSHNTLLPYTRSVCGPMDYTPRGAPYKDRTTICHQMALPYVYFSPLTFLYWYQDPLKLQRTGFTDPWDHLPTTWDESIYFNAEPGRFASSMKRSGDTWYYGMINGPSSRRAVVNLFVLEEEDVYSATVYADENLTLSAKRYLVDRTTILDEDVPKDGGLCVVLRPSTPADRRNLEWYPSWSRTSINVTVAEDDEMFLIVCTPGSEDSNVTYQALGGPDFLSFDPNRGIVSGMPRNDDVGIHHISIMVMIDDGPVGDIYLTLEVTNTNDPPVITDLPRHVECPPGGTVVVMPQAGDEDPTGDRLIWALTKDHSFINLDRYSGRMVISPSFSDLGAHLVEIEVQDGRGGICRERLLVFVNETGDRSRYRTLENLIFLTEDMYAEIDLTDTIFTEEQDVMELGMVRVPAFLSLERDTGILRGTPSQEDVGIHEIALRADFKDRDPLFVQFRAVVIERNDPPNFMNGSVMMVTAVGEVLDLRFQVTDEDDPVDEIRWSVLPEDGFLELSGESGDLTGIPGPQDVGLHSYHLSASDPHGASTVMDLTILVMDEGSLTEEDGRTRPSEGSGFNFTVPENSSFIGGLILLRNGSGRIMAFPMSEELRSNLMASASANQEEVEPSSGGSEDALDGLVLPLMMTALIVLVLGVLAATHIGPVRQRRSDR
ncbi:MAG: glycoside hydrolase family 97 catalytic domain-containing protein [Thermoplasmatota archaeon]